MAHSQIAGVVPTRVHAGWVSGLAISGKTFEKLLCIFTLFFYQDLQARDASELIHRCRQIFDVRYNQPQGLAIVMILRLLKPIFASDGL